MLIRTIKKPLNILELNVYEKNSGIPVSVLYKHRYGGSETLHG